jgi:hypothetical protein
MMETLGMRHQIVNKNLINQQCGNALYLEVVGMTLIDTEKEGAYKLLQNYAASQKLSI